MHVLLIIICLMQLLYFNFAPQVASTVLDRISDVSRVFPMAIDVGCGRGHIAKHFGEDSSDLIGSLYQCDMAEKAVVI